MLRTIPAALIIAACMSNAAYAADAVMLTGISGKVLTSRGGQTGPATAGALQPGDRVVASDGAARVVWADGCTATLKPRAMLTVSSASPCAGGNALVSAGSSAAQATKSQQVTALQWGGIGLSLIAIAAGIAAVADDISLSN